MKNTFLCIIGLFLLFGCFKKEVGAYESILSDSAIVDLADSATFKLNPPKAETDSIIIYGVADSTENVKMNYSDASKINSSEGWRKFLTDNPSYPNKEEINEKIIRAEVKEITNDKNTGEMPSAEKIGNSNSPESKVIIENDTSCELTIRYSGPDARRITIAPNSKGTVNLGSGNYTVAASACSYNYSGSEILSGNYSVVYYISSVRY